MNNIFERCKELTSLRDISKWKESKQLLFNNYMFYFDISVKDLCFEQIENILSMAFTLDVSQLEISGIDNNDSQPLNKHFIWIAL